MTTDARTMTSPPIIIVGGGITGLAAAHRVRRLRPQVPVIVLEGSNRPGGKIITDRVEGFVIEGGPDSFLASKPRGAELCRELGIDDRLEGTRQETRGSFIRRGGHLYPMPQGLTGLVPSRVRPVFSSSLLSPAGKVRLAMEPLVPARPGPADESVAGFIRRRFGDEVYTRLVEPLMAGIYAGNGAELSLAATFPQLKRMEREHGSVLRGSARSPAPPSRSASPFLAPIGGMGTVVEALANELGEGTVRCGSRVNALERWNSGYVATLEDGERLTARAVILATPAFASAEIIERLDPEIARSLAGIPYVSSATISLAYRADDVPRSLRGHGYVVPRAENGDVLACTWTSSKFDHRAPEGRVLLRVFVGRAGREAAVDLPDEDLLSLARAELEETIGITTPPLLRRIYRWPRGMPQYNLGHLDRLNTVAARLREHEGLFVAGSAFRGVGIPDCIASGEASAEAALALVT